MVSLITGNVTEAVPNDVSQATPLSYILGGVIAGMIIFVLILLLVIIAVVRSRRKKKIVISSSTFNRIAMMFGHKTHT